MKDELMFGIIIFLVLALMVSISECFNLASNRDIAKKIQEISEMPTSETPIESGFMQITGKSVLKTNAFENTKETEEKKETGEIKERMAVKEAEEELSLEMNNDVKIEDLPLMINSAQTQNEDMQNELINKKKSQSEILNERDSIITDEDCSSELAGTIQWNPYGSLCRTETSSTTSGLINPKLCCKKFYYGAGCTKNLGIIKRGNVEKSQFFLIGCYK